VWSISEDMEDYFARAGERLPGGKERERGGVMNLKVGVPKETFPGEHRVALVPPLVPVFTKGGFSVLIEAEAGTAAGFPDAAYQERGARIVAERTKIFDSADVILQVRSFGANPEAGRADLGLLHRDQVIIGFANPLGAPESTKKLAERGVTVFSLELIPRITRAQPMDALSSMATVSGYKTVLLAAEMLPRMFPMLITPAGTITPARVFVIGAGVAGLEAIATAHRLGAVVQAYDVRPVVKEQVESLGARFIEIPLETADAEDKGGYAKALGDEFYRRQREMLTQAVRESDVVITTAAVPGKKAPVLISGEMTVGMAPGSIIVDLAAEQGGNCELTRPGETVLEHGVRILGPVNLPSTVPYHSSQMYAKNISAFLLHLVGDGESGFDVEDEIVRETLVARGGEVLHPRVRELLGLAPLEIAGRRET
jgi:NAD(P) transhydrogenase subunit alpha